GISYDRGEPLLSTEIPEVVKEEPPVRPPAPPTQASLTEGSVARRERIKQLAEMSSFETQMNKPTEVPTAESFGSSATSGADEQPASSVEGISYDRGEPLLSTEIPEVVKEELPVRPPAPPTQASLTE